MNEKEVKVGFIGCGHMASSIIKGILSSNFLNNSQVFASEVSEEFAQAKRKELGIEVFTNNTTLANKVDVIFLATKPNYIKDVLQEVKNELTSDKLVVSIAAGVSTNAIESEIGSIPVIRVMPNGPAMVLEGMSGIVKGKYIKDEHLAFVEKLLSTIGKCLVVDEDKIDVLTAISGSGPAFFYEIIHEMALGGESLGLNYDDAILLAAQTAIGSAKLMLQSDLTPEQLVQGISTKGGCTEVGVDFMKKSNTEKLFYELIKQTADKASALGRK